MKKTIAFVIIVISISYCGCRKCGSPDNPTDPRLSSCFFKVGSYFIYNDTTDHIIDSQYAFLYSYQPNFVPLGSNEICPEYANQYEMDETSYRNGLLYDTISSLCNASPGYLITGDGGKSSGALYYPGMDTSFNNLVVDGHIYPTVYKNKTSGLIYGVTNIPVDYYFAPGYGVVKRVEHRPTGDVSWDLIRYHILP